MEALSGPLRAALKDDSSRAAGMPIQGNDAVMSEAGDPPL